MACVLNSIVFKQQIQHPTASLIAKASTAHDDVVGDGTTSIVLLIGEMMKLAEPIIGENCHPRVITDGLAIAKEKALQVLENIKIPVAMERPFLVNVAKTSLSTKVHKALAEQLAEVRVIKSTLCVKN